MSQQVTAIRQWNFVGQKNMTWDIFSLKYQNTKCGGETGPTAFSWKIKIDHTSGSTVWYFLQFAFVVCPSQGLPKYIKTKVHGTCFFYLT